MSMIDSTNSNNTPEDDTCAGEEALVVNDDEIDGSGAVAAEPVNDDVSKGERSDDGDSHDDLPTIELNSWEELQTAVLAHAKELEDDYPETPSIVADPLSASYRDEDITEHDVEVGCKMRHDSDCEWPDDNIERRAEFISFTFYKSSVNERLGLSLSGDKPSRIVTINRTDVLLLSGSPFQPGDVLISINTKRCSKMTSQAICELLTASTGFITIVANNVGGAADLVECAATKQSIDQKCGLAFRAASGLSGAIKVHSINPDGIFASSLLNRGDKVVSINDYPCAHADAPVVASIVKGSAKHVTIVARPCHERAIVVAEIPKRKCVRCLQLLVMKSSLWAPPNTKAPHTANEMSNKRLGKCAAVVFTLLIVCFFVTKSITDHHNNNPENNNDNLFP